VRELRPQPCAPPRLSGCWGEPPPMLFYAIALSNIGKGDGRKGKCIGLAVDGTVEGKKANQLPGN
ncbi:MAG: hypothetical protein WCA35_20645, partial [Kovacikia sp.]